jgi:hypothetical protein
MEMPAHRQRIRSFRVSQTARFVALLASLVTLLAAVPADFVFILATLIGLVKGSGAAAYLPMFLMGSLVVGPVAVFLLTFLLTALACVLYNALVPRFGGIEFELSPPPIELASSHR